VYHNFKIYSYLLTWEIEDQENAVEIIFNQIYMQITSNLLNQWSFVIIIVLILFLLHFYKKLIMIKHRRKKYIKSD